jgi:hypothetical protein
VQNKTERTGKHGQKVWKRRSSRQSASHSRQDNQSKSEMTNQKISQDKLAQTEKPEKGSMAHGKEKKRQNIKKKKTIWTRNEPFLDGTVYLL